VPKNNNNIVANNNTPEIDADTNLALIEMTSAIAAAYCEGNNVNAEAAAHFIQTTYQTLRGLTTGNANTTSEESRPLKPAVPVNKSIANDYIICLEDGKKLKMLKRHLKASYDMTPDDYRKKWGLAADYPMVAPNYAAHRSSLAKRIGLGTRGLKQAS
jgi:predicted transcriptional regulator